MAASNHSPIHVEIFNTFDRGGQVLWQTYKGRILQDCTGDSAPHLLVIGLGRLGESLVVHAARDWYGQLKGIPQLGNEAAPPCPASHSRMRITVIDGDADWKCQALRLRYPRLPLACDLIERAMDVRGPEFAEAAFLHEGPGCPGVDAVFVCLDDDSFSLRTALAIHHNLQQACTRAVPVIVRMAEAGGLSSLLDPGQDGNGVFANLHAFGLLDHTCRPDVILGGSHEILARTIHEYYQNSRKAAGDTPQSNASLVAWESLSEGLRNSNIAQADGISEHVQRLGYALGPLTDWDAPSFRFSAEEEKRLAGMEHERYLTERLSSGWTYAPGPKKNQTKPPTNPTLIPWAQLPDEEKQKNRAFARALPVILARAGFQIARQNAKRPDFQLADTETAVSL